MIVSILYFIPYYDYKSMFFGANLMKIIDSRTLQAIVLTTFKPTDNVCGRLYGIADAIYSSIRSIIQRYIDRNIRPVPILISRILRTCSRCMS
jgi:hypothetical protein